MPYLLDNQPTKFDHLPAARLVLKPHTSSAHDDIYALRKVLMRSATSSRGVPCVAIQTVQVFVRLMTTHSRPVLPQSIASLFAGDE